ncbi:MAG TPA: lipocalin-like domain-containing protein [Thermoanaerobaculia bacterium]|nr:lipocalin-like domain-containing protein [Thermoanaerobaculia bacterium]
MNGGPAMARFVGVWSLEAICDCLPDGRVEDHPDFGSNPNGLIVYTASGHVAVQFMRSGRPRWRNEDNPTDAERAEAARGYGAYAGRYEVDEAAGVVHHDVETALIPNRIGVTLTRFFSFEGDKMTLSPPRFLRDGVEVDRTLVWRRLA